MNRCLFFLVIGVWLWSVSMSLYAFYPVPYIETPKNNFSIGTMIETNAVQNDGRKMVNNRVIFNFNNLAYGFSLYPLEVPETIELSDSFSLGEDLSKFPLEKVLFFSHHFMWEPFDFKVPVIKSQVNIQLGMLNFGLGKKAFQREETKHFNRYFHDGFITWRIKPLSKAPFFMYYSIYNLKADAEYHASYAMSIEKEGYLFKIESTSELTLLRTEVQLFGGLVFKLGAYPFDSQVKKLGFQPKYFYELELRSKLFKLKKEKQTKIAPVKKLPPVKKKLLKPLPFDKKTLIHMEKGSLEYYNMQYRTAMFHYEKVVERYPSFTLGWERLGSIYYELGLYKKAKKSWEIVQDYEPLNEDMAFYLHKLNEEMITPKPKSAEAPVDEKVDAPTPAE